jgi:RNA polymerase sigma factor (sigma-70 family)
MTVAEYNTGIDLYSDGLYRFIRKTLGDDECAKDIVHDVFEKLWRNLETVENTNFKSYLFCAGAYLLKMEQRRIKHLPLKYEVGIEKSGDGEQYNPSKSELDKILARLPEEQRMAIVLKEYEGFTSMEIGEILNVNSVTIRQHISRAKTVLQKCIGSPDNII